MYYKNLILKLQLKIKSNGKRFLRGKRIAITAFDLENKNTEV